MPIYRIQIERTIERIWQVQQESAIWVEASDIEKAEEAVEALSHEGDSIDAYCNWTDIEDGTEQTSEDEQSVLPTGIKITGSGPVHKKRDTILRASEVLREGES